MVVKIKIKAEVLISNFYKIKYRLLFIVVSIFISSELFAQEYQFSEIKEIFLKERPQTGDLAVREDCFGSIDDLIMGSYPPLHPDTKSFYTFMIRKAILEIKNEVVTEGATIWLLYNHGFVVKTPSVTFGCDLRDFFSTEIFLELANLIDAYFISHGHPDHYTWKLVDSMSTLDKPVVGPAQFALAPIKMKAGDSMVIAGLSVTAHDGLHGGAYVRQFEIVTPDGFKFLHTGDNESSKTLPSITDIDVMFLNNWINELGSVSSIKGVRIAVNKMKPKVTLPGHMMELGHLSTPSPFPYRDPIAADDGTLASEYYILAWGERYHYGNASNDTIKPNIVENLTYTVSTDTIGLLWNTPLPADDGDTGSFYRVIINDTVDFFVSEQQFDFPADTLGKYNIKVFSYDDCGNQSETYAEIEEISGIGNDIISTSQNPILFQNDPNPFNAVTTFTFNLPSKCFVTLKIFDAVGRELETVISGELERGRHTTLWNAKGLSSGIYYYRIQAGNFTGTKRLVILR
jgi:L-ascorbate metabolism protein UlaG (beta-lactamase superfamily)